MFYLKITVFIILFPLFAQAQEKQLWQGQQGSKRVLVELTTTPEGQPRLFFSLPEAWVNRVEADSLVLTPGGISASCTEENIRFEGTFTSDGDSITATLSRYNQTLCPRMGRVDSLQPHYYPQNPRPPYPYRSEEVVYTSCDSIRVVGTVTIPPGEGPFPAAIIVSGTGKQDRDGTFAGHKPFARIADELTRRGYIVLRTDDRGTGATNGTYEMATTRDFARDAWAGIDYLKTLPVTDPSRVGVIGHSEGGQVAFMLEYPGLAFVVSLAGVGVDGLQILELQNRAILETTPGITPEKVDAFMDLFVTLFRAVHAVPLDQSLDEPVRAAFDEWLSRQDTATLEALNFTHGRDESFFSRYLYQARGQWYREMIRYNPADYIPRITCPVLALNGDRDIMVPSAENLSSIRQLLDRGDNRRYKIVELPGLNHMFQRCVTGTREEIPDLEDVFSAEALEILGKWLLSLHSKTTCSSGENIFPSADWKKI